MYLWVPPVETWTLDTLRMVFGELASHLPLDPNATAGVTLEWSKPRTSRPPTLRNVTPWVCACGWRVQLDMRRNEREEKRSDGTYAWAGLSIGSWTEPMIAALVEIEAKSPLALAAMGHVAPLIRASRVPSRLWLVREKRAELERRGGLR